ncbi:MAG: hypothetical protein JXA97_10755 [Anaerolineales bacterium]|nr:hypothetical protein [Anaerolineales bacterium]
MIAWINAAVLVFATLGMHIFYLLSVRPAQLEQRIGEAAYKRCWIYRMIASLLMGVITINYILYHWHPLPIDPLPSVFPWPYGVSALIAAMIALPSGYLMLRATQDAGEETLRPDKSHSLYGGIYEKMRHPMAVGELPLWWVIAFLVHSPAMAIYSLVHIPIFAWWCFAEEKDLFLRYGDAYAVYRERTGIFFPKRKQD